MVPNFFPTQETVILPPASTFVRESLDRGGQMHCIIYLLSIGEQTQIGRKTGWVEKFCSAQIRRAAGG
jgi:hypothetical protein